MLLHQLWLSGWAGAGAVACSSSMRQLFAAAPILSDAASAMCSQVQFASTSTSSSASASASTAVTSKQQQQKQPKQKQQPKPSSGTSDAVAAADAAAQAASQQQLALLQQDYQRSRLQEFATNHLARELLLKLNVANVHQLPRVNSIDLTINAKDTHGRRYAEKWEMLLPALALEYITGKPATFVQSTLKYYRSRNAITAVKVRLEGGDALDLLQKLTFLVLPSQNAFSGISTRSLDKAGNLHFRVQKLINFPDFEEQFEIFENLGSLRVSINMRNTGGLSNKGRSQLLLTGLQLPMLQKAGAAVEEEQEASDEESEDSESDGSMPAADD